MSRVSVLDSDLSFNYWETSLALLVGGTLAILFVILLRRNLVADAKLPFPESYGCFEIAKAGQKGETGAKYAFGALGLGMLVEILKNSSGIAVLRETVEFFVRFPRSVVHRFFSSREVMESINHIPSWKGLSVPGCPWACSR